MKSEAAQVAALIRKEIKTNGIKAKVTSSNYAGGNSVYVTVYDQYPSVVEKIEDFCRQYKSGYFDGQTDCYVYKKTSNATAKYIFVKNVISEDLLQACWDYLKKRFGLDDAPVQFSDAYKYHYRDQFGDNWVYRELSKNDGFWSTQKPRVTL